MVRPRKTKKNKPKTGEPPERIQEPQIVVDDFDEFDEIDVMMTIRRFILRYFGPDRPKGTPTRGDVVRWMRRGTVEGVFLRGRQIDGKYYVRVADADSFFEELRVARMEDKFAKRLEESHNEKTLRYLYEEWGIGPWRPAEGEDQRKRVGSRYSPRRSD